MDIEDSPIASIIQTNRCRGIIIAEQKLRSRRKEVIVFTGGKVQRNLPATGIVVVAFMQQETLLRNCNVSFIQPINSNDWIAGLCGPAIKESSDVDLDWSGWRVPLQSAEQFFRSRCAELAIV